MPSLPPLPPHTDARLPIHSAISSELRAFHTKYPGPTLSSLLETAVRDLRESSADLAEARRELIFERDTSDGTTPLEKDPDTELRIARLGNGVEKNVRGLLDLSENMKLMKKSLGQISDREKNKGEGGVGGQPVNEFVRLMKEGKRNYKKRDLKDRYDVAEYLDYRKMVHIAANPNAPVPSKKDMFRTPIFITDVRAEMSEEEQSPVEEEDEDEEMEEPSSSQPQPLQRRSQKRSQRRAPSQTLSDAEEQEEDDDEELAVTSEQKSLKCPLTMKYYVHPVTTACGHTYERDALIDLLKTHKRMKKPPMCPTPGCPNQLKSDKDWSEDDIMKRRVQMQMRKEEREAEEAMEEDDDEDEEEEDAPRANKRSRASVAPKVEEEIPYGDEEEEGEGDEGEDEEMEDGDEDEDDGDDGEESYEEE